MPGWPRQVGQTCVLGSALPGTLAQPQKALVAVLSWKWHSMPITASYWAWGREEEWEEAGGWAGAPRRPAAATGHAPPPRLLTPPPTPACHRIAPSFPLPPPPPNPQPPPHQDVGRRRGDTRHCSWRGADGSQAPPAPSRCLHAAAATQSGRAAASGQAEVGGGGGGSHSAWRRRPRHPRHDAGGRGRHGATGECGRVEPEQQESSRAGDRRQHTEGRACPGLASLSCCSTTPEPAQRAPAEPGPQVGWLSWCWERWGVNVERRS